MDYNFSRCTALRQASVALHWSFIDNKVPAEIGVLGICIIFINMCLNNYKQPLYWAVICKLEVSDFYFLVFMCFLSISHNFMVNDTKPSEIIGFNGKRNIRMCVRVHTHTHTHIYICIYINYSCLLVEVISGLPYSQKRKSPFYIVNNSSLKLPSI